MVEGERTNLKVTGPEDLVLMTALLAARSDS
jgi:2-C-methyl-D-erythritol 4-phosphate cytidylyltransferase